jgi:putative component of membrane protein insertase Oxa1/YidC/SpoIIIJ protein YidD
MKWVILTIIKVYWQLIPAYRRKHCLFKETCSSHVYRVIVEQGVLKGCKAFLLRWRQCRPGYQILLDSSDKGLVIKLVDNTIICSDLISPNILNPVLLAANKLELMLSLQKNKHLMI